MGLARDAETVTYATGGLKGLHLLPDRRMALQPGQGVWRQRHSSLLSPSLSLPFSRNWIPLAPCVLPLSRPKWREIRANLGCQVNSLFSEAGKAARRGKG